MILITGGFGFLGVHLSHTLGKDVYQSNQDICEMLDYSDITHIYNLAGTPSPVKYVQNPVRVLETNTKGVLNILKLAKLNNAKVLQASTGEVEENSDHLEKRSCYRFGKKIAETICMDYHRQYGVEVGILRMYNSYGPGMKLDDGRVIPEFIRKALLGEDIVVFGGRQTRSFCYVDDMVSGMIQMMASKLVGPISICNPEEVSISELAEFIVAKCNSISKIIYKPRRKEDQDQINPTTNLAQDLLNWAPKTRLEDGLTLTIDYFKKRMGYVAERN